MKQRNKKGFTLAELLIVVAIVAVLAAIAIPIFNMQLDKARQGVDTSNLRAAKSMAAADALQNADHYSDGTYYYRFDEDPSGNLIMYDLGTADDNICGVPTYGVHQKGDMLGKSKANHGKHIYIKVVDHKINEAKWAD